MMLLRWHRYKELLTKLNGEANAEIFTALSLAHVLYVINKYAYTIHDSRIPMDGDQEIADPIKRHSAAAAAVAASASC